MPVATATVTVNDEGVVQGLRTMNSEFEQLGESAEGADESVQEFEETTGSAVGRMDQYNESVEEGFGLTRQLRDAQEQLAQGGSDMVASFDRQADAMEQIENQTKSLSTRSSKFNQIVFSSGDLVQDLQFGIKGAANNIAFMAEQMAETAGEAGGFMGMLKGVGSSLMGPAGIILALQTLLALGPKIASWFDSRTKEAEELKGAISEAAEGMLDIKESIDGVEVEDLEQAQQAVENLESNISDTERQISTLERVSGLMSSIAEVRQSERQAMGEEEAMGEDVRTVEELRNQAKEILGISQDRQLSREELRKQIDQILPKLQRELSAQKAAKKEANNTVEAFRARKALQDAFLRAGAQTEDQQEGVKTETLAWSDAMRKVHEIQNRLIEQTGEINFEEELDIPKAAFVEDIADAEQALQQGLVDSIAGVNNVLDLLKSEFEQATSDAQRSRIRRLINGFEELRAEMRRGKEETKSFQDVLDSLNKQRIIASAISEEFTQLGKAIGQGERVMESFGEAALGVLGSIGKAIGKQLIAQGSAMIASALIPGMQGNAAAGAALVAAGTSLVAASTGLTSVLSEEGDSGGRGPGDREALEGGGRASTEVNTPGRRFGGPVQAGRLYQTHGLGSREFFRPAISGQVMTRNQMRSATTRNQNVNVSGSMQAQIGVESVEVDTRLERLRLELNDLDREINDLT